MNMIFKSSIIFILESIEYWGCYFSVEYYVKRIVHLLIFVIFKNLYSFEISVYDTYK